MTYSSYKKFLKAKMEDFDKTVALFGAKYSDDETPNMYGVSKSFIDAQFKEIFSQALLEAVEAGIAASKIEENKHKFWDGYFLGGEDSLEVKKMNEGYNAALAEAEKQSKSWLEK